MSGTDTPTPAEAGATTAPAGTQDKAAQTQSRPVDLPVTLGLVAMPLAVFASAWWIEPGWNVLASMAALTFFLLLLGKSISGTPYAVIISERNLMSLSQLQTAVWTVVVLAGYLTTVVARMKLNVPNATDVGVPQELWVLMGVSLTSLVGTPLILSTKKAQTPSDDALRKAADQLGEDKEDIQGNGQGTLYANASMEDARFSDMFLGDEIGNAAHIDLAKVQMFYFTVISVVVYVALIAKGLKTTVGLTPLPLNATEASVTDFVKSLPSALTSLPALSSGMVALLTISHGGYLASKMGSRTPSK